MKTLRYTPIARAIDYLKLGWLIVGDLHYPHRDFSVIGEWLCDCRCVEPAERA